ncbi:MAG: hypothetical protein AAFV54_10240, partial [Pseudomonadota bacterium]
MAKLKLTLLVLTILLATATFGSYKLGFHFYRAGIETAPGEFSYHDRAFMEACGKARMTSLIQDPVGFQTWSRCEATMQHYGTQDAFIRRHTVVSVLAILSVISFGMFAWFAIKATKPPKVVRGRIHFKGTSALRELRKVSRKECKRSGSGIEFP